MLAVDGCGGASGKPHVQADAGDGDAESAFNKMVDATMQAAKCGRAQAVSKVMTTPQGTKLYRQARESRMVNAATSQ